MKRIVFYKDRSRIICRLAAIVILTLVLGSTGCVDRQVTRIRQNLNDGALNCGPGVRRAPVWRLSKSALISDSGTGCDLIITYTGNNCTATLIYDRINKLDMATNESRTESLKGINEADLTCKRPTVMNSCCEFRIEEILCGRPRSMVNINFVDRVESGSSPCGAPPTVIWRAQNDERGNPKPSHVTLKYQGSRLCAPRMLALTRQGDQINVSGFMSTPLTPIVRTFRDVLSILYVCIPRQQFIPVEEGEEPPETEPVPPGEACTWSIQQVEFRTP